MVKTTRKRTTLVREHPRDVPISKKNPDGKTVVDQHFRRLRGTYLDPNEIDLVFKNYLRKSLRWPTAGKLGKYKNSDNYDELIALWVSYFNQKFDQEYPLDPDTLKALIASESGFRLDPDENKAAIGLTQITRTTWKILQDPKGAAKEFIFKGIRQKDLKDPRLAIPMATRWLFRKRETAKSKLDRVPDHEELILEYKGLLKSKSSYKDSALRKFKEDYAALKKQQNNARHKFINLAFNRMRYIILSRALPG